mgnify:CR=1 FL=1
MNNEYEDVLNTFENYNAPNIFRNTRQMGVIEYRQLFHTIMRKKYKKTFQEIADYCTSIGKPTHHATVFNSLKKTIDTNYYAYEHVAEIYDAFFEDKREQRLAKLISQQKKTGTNKLIDLLNDIPEHKTSEIMELVKLRIQSWQWRGIND